MEGAFCANDDSCEANLVCDGESKVCTTAVTTSTTTTTMAYGTCLLEADRKIDTTDRNSSQVDMENCKEYCKTEGSKYFSYKGASEECACMIAEGNSTTDFGFITGQVWCEGNESYIDVLKIEFHHHSCHSA